MLLLDIVCDPNDPIGTAAACLQATPPGTWFNSGDNAWQLTAATFVGLMSVPGLAILYAGLMKRKWALNSAIMVLYAFASTLLVWTLFAYRMGFGSSATGAAFPFIGMPEPITQAAHEIGQANIPLFTGPALHFPTSAMAYFQFVFAAITVILVAGSVLGRMNFKAWLIFAPVWIALVYTVNAYALWGGGWLTTFGTWWPAWVGHGGAVDYSGGYVIHVAAGISGTIAAIVVGPRLLKDRQENNPSNLLMAIAGGGLLWLGWSGFNGGDPYFSNPDAAAAVLNTHLATATAMLVWMFLDVFTSGKANIGGMINGMIAGLVGITPGAGFVDGFGAIIIGVVCSAVPWFTMQVLPRFKFFAKIDDTLGVMHTHGFAGALGGLLVGLIANPAMVEYYGSPDGKVPAFSVGGLFATGDWHQLAAQGVALAFIVLYDGIATFIILKIISILVPLRMSKEHLEVGDEMVHGDVSLDLGTVRPGMEPASVPLTH